MELKKEQLSSISRGGHSHRQMPYELFTSIITFFIFFSSSSSILLLFKILVETFDHKKRVREINNPTNHKEMGKLIM